MAGSRGRVKAESGKGEKGVESRGPVLDLDQICGRFDCPGE